MRRVHICVFFLVQYDRMLAKRTLATLRNQ